jgi:hypothetical protein
MVRLQPHGDEHIRTIAKITSIVRVTCLFRPRGLPREHNYRLLFCICTLSFQQYPHTVLFFLYTYSLIPKTITFKSKPKTVLLAYCVVHKDMPQKSLKLNPLILNCYGNTNKRPTRQTPCLLSFY